MAKSRTLNVMGVGEAQKTDLRGAAAVNFFGSDMMFADPVAVGWNDGDSPNPSAHPNKVNPGGPVKFID